MAKKQVDGDGLDIPNRIKAVPVKRTGPIVAAIIVALFRARQTTHVEDISSLKF